ncbi:hypothetical protein HYALB_00009889 [Hymenoscyphus albidus]|uniref:P-loop containing nucleoside triphosphate hydrolase protein n=1 Tax=Hymenoscyphus albidus TaxID=595503 RepID=A0A9N9LYT1_9HELO|nr:hypothetical protein HYALB_00009889 [Hymenoscyphus albidus]
MSPIKPLPTKSKPTVAEPSSWRSNSKAPVESSADEVERLRSYHIQLLQTTIGKHDRHEATTTPIFTMPVLEHFKETSDEGTETAFPQYGLLAGQTDLLNDNGNGEAKSGEKDPRLFFNIAAPSSTFICGSQGSGKSHTLSCLLENCLSTSDASTLPHPLTGLVFHYDTFISDDGGSPCEAAFLSSNPNISKSYARLPNVEIEPLKINQSNLNTKRMLDLMAVKQDDGPMPLYLHAIHRILREMRMEQQESGSSFDYGDFRRKVALTPMTPAQLSPLQQRLDTLESFMPKAQTESPQHSRVGINGKRVYAESGNDWTPKRGRLTIVDLSCPCVTPESACGLFKICLNIFLDQAPSMGRIVALDEAHKYMNASAEASALTETLLSTIRLQRHLGARIIISTQEPTISPKLLGLSSVTIVHRFTSPEWLRTLEAHLAGAASYAVEDGEESGEAKRSKKSLSKQIFTDIVKLRVGEALLFSPTAVTGLEANVKGDRELKRLGAAYLKIRVRARLTTDGGKSIMAD